jgi:small conductance mechanosensitive channel
MEDLLVKVQEIVGLYGLKIIAALFILLLGRWAAMIFRYIIKKVLLKSKVDETIVSFTGHLTYIGLLAFVIIAALGQLGIQTTSFIAVLGAAGLAIGLALQGSLSNFASGFLMIIFRPFKVGDKIDAAGVTGVVEEIQIFTTVLKTPDNKTIIIPNAKITDDNIVNYSAKGTMRVDLVVGIGYGDDIDKARAVIQSIIDGNEKIFKDPAPVIAVMELGDSSVNFAVRAWAKTDDYWDVYFNLTETVKKRFDAEGINIPFPQRDIHVYNH